MSLEILLTWLLTLLIFSCTILLTRRKPRHSLPPGPMPLPVIGNLHQLGFGPPHRSLVSLSQKFGELMYLRLGTVPTLIVSSADAASDIFKNHDLAFSSRPSLWGLSKFSYGCASTSQAPYGTFWREIRKIAVLELLTMKQVQSFKHIRVEEVSLMIELISRQASGTGRGIVNLSAAAFTLSNDFVYRLVFGALDRTNGEVGFMEVFHELQYLFGAMNIVDFIPWLGWVNKFNGMNKKLDKSFQDMDRFMDSVLEDHVDPTRPKPEREDIVDVLFRLQKDPYKTIHLTNDQIKGIVLDLFIAGTDTSSATIVWVMTELLRNPKAMHVVQEEVRALAKGKSIIEEPDLPNLIYLKQVIKETFRVHPPLPLLVLRETIESCIIGEHHRIPKGVRVLFNLAAIQMDPKHWENPNQFRPERFVDGKVDFRGQNFELMPFGTGRRGCPGINIAIPLVELALANLLYRFDWATTGDIDVEEDIGLAVHKKNPLCLVAKIKHNASVI